MSYLAIFFAGVLLIVGLAWHMWPHVCCDHIGLEPAPPGQIHPCERPLGKNLGKDLLEKGYTAVPGLLTAEESKILTNFAQQLPWSEHQRGYKFASTEKLAAVFPEELIRKLRRIIDSIHRDSDLRVANENGSDVFSTGSQPNSRLRKVIPPYSEFISTNVSDRDNSADFFWHLDNMGWYISQQSRNYVNMYLIIDKPDPADSGLMVIPRDVLLSRSPKLYELTHNSGAMTFLPNVDDTQTLLMDSHEYDHYYVLDFRIEDLACVPGLRTGDLLMVRGDTMHRTQTSLRSSRLALSFRVFQDQYSNEKMLTGGLLKYARMLGSLPKFVDRAVKNSADPFGGKSLLEWHVYLRVHAGYWYRRSLLPIRSMTGMLIGEPMFPVTSY